MTRRAYRPASHATARRAPVRHVPLRRVPGGRALAACVLLAAATLAGCVENTAPGNDREAALEPPAEAARVALASTVLSGVAPELLVPATLTEADLSSLREDGRGCRFRMTRVGFPVFAYPAGVRGPGVMKLNGRLVPLNPAGERRWESDRLQVTLTYLDDAPGPNELVEAEWIVRIPGAPHERGFRGYAGC